MTLYYKSLKTKFSARFVTEEATEHIQFYFHTWSIFASDHLVDNLDWLQWDVSQCNWTNFWARLLVLFWTSCFFFLIILQKFRAYQASKHCLWALNLECLPLGVAADRAGTRRRLLVDPGAAPWLTVRIPTAALAGLTQITAQGPHITCIAKSKVGNSQNKSWNFL